MSFLFVNARDLVVCEGDQVVVNLEAYGIESTAHGTVVCLNGDETTFRVIWDARDALTLGIDAEWRWVNVQYVVDVTHGLAPSTPVLG